MLQVKNATGKVPIPKLMDVAIKNRDTVFGSVLDVALKSNGYGWANLLKGNKTEVLSPKVGLQAVIYIINEKGQVKSGTDRFFLEFISEPISEKVNVSETFAENDPSIYIFGKKNLPVTFSGSMYNAHHERQPERTQWENGFKEWWKTSLRAGALLKNKGTDGPLYAMLLVDNEVFLGYPIRLSFMKTSTEDMVSKFSMTWLIAEKSFLTKMEPIDDFMNFGDSAKIKKMLDTELSIQRDLLGLNGLLTVIENSLVSGKLTVKDFSGMPYSYSEKGTVITSKVAINVDENGLQIGKGAWDKTTFKDNFLTELPKLPIYTILVPFIRTIIDKEDPLYQADLVTSMTHVRDTLLLLEKKLVLGISASTSSLSSGASDASKIAMDNYKKLTDGLKLTSKAVLRWRESVSAQIGAL